MYLSAAIDEIREKLVRHRLAPRKFLWATILKEIAKQNSFNGAYVDTILEITRSFLDPLDDNTIISLYRETEVGMGDDPKDGCPIRECACRDVEMEILKQLTDLAWEEAKGRQKKIRRKTFDDPDWERD